MTEATKRNAPLWVKVFVPLHIIAITSWALPYPPRDYQGEHPVKRLAIRTDNPVAFAQSVAEYARTGLLMANERYGKNSPLKFYVLGTGFWQYWDMFSPNPAYIDIYCDAVITYADGSKKLYQYPRMFTLSLGQKFLKERWRKFFERAGDPEFSFLRKPFGQRIALLNYLDPQNPPLTVELHKHAFTVRPPGEPVNTAYTDTIFYTYHVDLAKLRRDKGQ